MAKSHVGMGLHLCPVCGIEHDHNAVVLLDRTLKNSLDRSQVVGWEFCVEHARMRNEGYIALVGVSNEPTGMSDAERTGEIAYIRASLWPSVFDVPAPTGGIGFAGPEVFTMLKEGMPVDEAQPQ